jgi:hypothetical protein
MRNGADGEIRTLVGQYARQFTKLLLSLLSHIGGNGGPFKWGSAEFRVQNFGELPTGILHFAFSICIKKARREGGVEPPQPGL